MKTIAHISRILVGATFIFSGFVKGIDPWGSTYKFTDYFNAMGLAWLVWAAFPLGVLLAFAEFAIGVALLWNIFMRMASWLALLFMAFFLPLTLWIALKNPVSDCGCFGDALVLSNWETFYKNLAIIAFALIVFAKRKQIAQSGNNKPGYLFSSTFAIAYVIIAIYSYNHLPIIDFRPYKVGVNIPEAMATPDDAKQEVYKNVFYYKNKKTGKIKKFNEGNYPWQDSANWEYSNVESILVQEGYRPPIHDLTVTTADGEDILDFFIYDENYVFVVVAYNLEKSDTKSQEKINHLAKWALGNNFSFIGLTSTLPENYQGFAEGNNVPYEYFNCDEITLKTIIRSNPGLVAIKNGAIVGKWHYNDIPTPGEFQNKFMNK